MNFPAPHQLHETIGDIDIYFLDQILKGRIQPGMKILDAGCGGGRNLVYLLRSGFEVFGTDQEQVALHVIRELVATLAPELPQENFRDDKVEKMSFKDASFDWVISNAVLHFVDNQEHFDAMVNEMWRVLRPGGVLFVRLASDIGIEKDVRWIEGRKAQLPDGSERFLVNQEMLFNATRRLKAELIEPLKTVNVMNLRCMTNWILRKPG